MSTSQVVRSRTLVHFPEAAPPQAIQEVDLRQAGKLKRCTRGGGRRHVVVGIVVAPGCSCALVRRVMEVLLLHRHALDARQHGKLTRRALLLLLPVLRPGLRRI